MLFQFLNIIIGNDHVVSLGRCGPLPVMLASLFILDSISGISSIKKVPASVFCWIKIKIKSRPAASVFKKNGPRNNPLFF